MALIHNNQIEEVFGIFLVKIFTSNGVCQRMIQSKIYFTALGSLALNPNLSPIPDFILEKHHLRKHGPGAYYGQEKHLGPAT